MRAIQGPIDRIGRSDCAAVGPWGASSLPARAEGTLCDIPKDVSGRTGGTLAASWRSHRRPSSRISWVRLHVAVPAVLDACRSRVTASLAPSSVAPSRRPRDRRSKRSSGAISTPAQCARCESRTGGRRTTGCDCIAGMASSPNGSPGPGPCEWPGARARTLPPQPWRPARVRRHRGSTGRWGSHRGSSCA